MAAWYDQNSDNDIGKAIGLCLFDEVRTKVEPLLELTYLFFYSKTTSTPSKQSSRQRRMGPRSGMRRQ